MWLVLKNITSGNPNYAIEANEMSELLALVGLTPI
jgi:hypothetical protein